MGVLNVTPNSFSDGGLYLGPEGAKRRVDELLREGADIVDIGGESTQPRAEPVSAEEQIARIEHPLVYAARERHAVVSVDTTNADVARFALENGASIVNDVSCLADDELARLAARAGASLVLMHSRGSMTRMRDFSDASGETYGDIVADVLEEWTLAKDRAVRAGLPAGEIVLDPGLGYMKSELHSLSLVERLAELKHSGAPILVGPGRKSFIDKIAQREGEAPAGPGERLGGTIAVCLACAARGADILRVHDVHPVRQALILDRALRGGAHA
jgi:dihydropteroate synthase